MGVFSFCRQVLCLHHDDPRNQVQSERTERIPHHVDLHLSRHQVVPSIGKLRHRNARGSMVLLTLTVRGIRFCRRVHRDFMVAWLVTFDLEMVNAYNWVPECYDIRTRKEVYA